MLSELDATVLGTVLIGGGRSAVAGYYGEQDSPAAPIARQRESRNGKTGGRVARGAPTGDS